MGDIANRNLEIDLFLEAMYKKYGYDFRNYSRASIKRRIEHRLKLTGLKTISAMQHELINNWNFFEIVLRDFSINVTEMFRDPSFYKAIREEIIPKIKDFQQINIWHAGCATGEEVYSIAVLLKEEGIYDKTRIYATDFNKDVLEKAKQGVYPAKFLKQYILNYREAGGMGSFTDYYTAKYEFVLMDSSLKKNILFSDHNLTCDTVFGEMDVIICRNVIIYFNIELQNHVFKLFLDALGNPGFLCLGSKETVSISDYVDNFEAINRKEKIYKKVDKRAVL
ncbi:MAG: protein-glutamate O-methyltransferase CheR [Desulfobacteraceae bacterium]|nr:protein-glutamate O-methyltransferase CheR [Desulfobacteraceae bacterium]